MINKNDPTRKSHLTYNPSTTAVGIDQLREVVGIDQSCAPSQHQVNSVDCALKYLSGLLETRDALQTKGVRTNMDVALRDMEHFVHNGNDIEEQRQASHIKTQLEKLYNYGVTDVGYKPLAYCANGAVLPEGQFVLPDHTFVTYDANALLERIGLELGLIQKCEKLIVDTLNDKVLSRYYKNDPRLIRIAEENRVVSEAALRIVVLQPKVAAPTRERRKVIVRKGAENIPAPV